MSSIKGLIVGMLCVSLIAVIFSSFYAGLNSQYANTDYSDSSIQTFDKTENLSSRVEEIRDSLKPEYDSGIADLIGAYFKAGYNSLYLGFESLNLFDTMARDVSEQSNLPIGGKITTILIGIVIVIVVFLIIAALLNRAGI